MTNILGLSGRKQSGKTTSSTFLHGYQLRYNDVVEKFIMEDEGNLIVNAVQIDEKGEEIEGMGFLDIERKDPEFIEYANRTIWPYVKSFSFADPLKVISMQLFGLTEAQCYGTDEDKNTPINIKWENMPVYKLSSAEKTGFMTAREFLQYFGTNVCRTIKDSVWVDNCITRMLNSGTELAIVPDIRFPNEVKAIQKAGGKVIRLTRSPHEDSHPSEISLDNYEGFDHVIDNKNMDIDETNMELMNTLRKWEWLKTKSS